MYPNNSVVVEDSSLDQMTVDHIDDFTLYTMSIQGDHSACAKPPVDFKTKVPLWPGQARADQAKAELLS